MHISRCFIRTVMLYLLSQLHRESNCISCFANYFFQLFFEIPLNTLNYQICKARSEAHLTLKLRLIEASLTAPEKQLLDTNKEIMLLTSLTMNFLK